MRDTRERLRDILEAIERMERHALKGRKAFDEDELIQTWMVHQTPVAPKSYLPAGTLALPEVTCRRGRRRSQELRVRVFHVEHSGSLFDIGKTSFEL